MPDFDTPIAPLRPGLTKPEWADAERRLISERLCTLSWEDRLKELRLVGEMTGALSGLVIDFKDKLDPKVLERLQDMLRMVKAQDFTHKCIHAGGMKALVAHEAL